MKIIKFQIGKGNVVRQGNDVSIIACGIMVNEAILAHEALKIRRYKC